MASGAVAHAKPHRKPYLAAPSPEAKALADAEARMNAMSDEIATLKARLDQVSGETQARIQAAETKAAAAEADAHAAKAELAEQIQTVPGEIKAVVAADRPKTDKLYVHGVSVTLGGFAEAAGIYRSRDETADIASSFAKIPYANDRASHTQETNFSAHQTRVQALVEGDVSPTTHAYFYGELDFQGAPQTANSNESNSYTPRLRHLFGAVDWEASGWHLLAGQNWSLVTLNSHGIMPRFEVTPPQIDGAYLPGFAWARQPQVRLTKDFDKKLWLAVSLENPQTTLSVNGVASGVTLTDNQLPTNGYYSGTAYSLNRLPDMVGKVALEQPIGDRNLHLEAFGVLRSFYDRVTVAPSAANQAGALGLAAGAANLETYGGGFGAGFTLNAIPKLLDLQGSVMTGEGIGRYGAAGLPDATARADGRLEGIPETMWLAGATLHPIPQLDLYVFGGSEEESGKVYRYAALPASVAFGYGTLPGSSNAGCLVEGGACSALTRSIEQITTGFWDRFYQGPYGRLQVGVQYSHTTKKAFADATAAGLTPKADEDMVFTSFRYYPF